MGDHLPPGGQTGVVEIDQPVRRVDWRKSALGEVSCGIFFTNARDRKTVGMTTEIESTDHCPASGYARRFIGGGGKGTLNTTEAWRLNHGRNRHLPRQVIESSLWDYLNIQR